MLSKCQIKLQPETHLWECGTWEWVWSLPSAAMGSVNYWKHLGVAAVWKRDNKLCLISGKKKKDYVNIKSSFLKLLFWWLSIKLSSLDTSVQGYSNTLFPHKSFFFLKKYCFFFSESLLHFSCSASYTVSKITDRLKCSAVISNCVDCAWFHVSLILLLPLPAVQL